MGARARARLRQQHLLARQPPQERLREPPLADEPDRGRLSGPVLLPLPDRAPDVQRNAHLYAIARYGALAPPAGLAAESPAFVSPAAGGFFGFDRGAAGGSDGARGARA